MRICLLGDAGSIHLQRWAGYFSAAGEEVHVISFRPGDVSPARLHLLAGGKGAKAGYPQAVARIRSLVKEIRPDILNAHYATSFGLLGILSGFHPLVVSAWGSDVLVAPQQSRWLRWTVQRVLRQADGITSDSAYMSEKITAMLGGARKPLVTVTMGVSQAWFDTCAGVDPQPLQILSLRGHQPAYNIDIVIRAMAETVKRVPQAALVVVGQGPETPKLKELAASLGLGAQVRFTGQLSHPEVKRYLSESALSVSVPTSDATAVSLLETMACGPLPVVSDLPANREWIDDGSNGLIVSARDPHDLAQALVRGLEDQLLQRQARALNRAKISQRAIWENNMAEIAGLYRSLARSK